MNDLAIQRIVAHPLRATRPKPQRTTQAHSPSITLIGVKVDCAVLAELPVG